MIGEGADSAKLQNNCETRKKIQEKFGTSRKSSYLCSVKANVLAIRVESRGGQVFIDIVLGARHHDHYSVFKTIPWDGFIVRMLF